VAQGVVYDLELVQVHEQHGNPVLLPPGALQGVPEAVHEELAVREVGQVVVERLVFEAFFGLRALGDIPTDGLVLDDATINVEDSRVGPLQPAHSTGREDTFLDRTTRSSIVLVGLSGFSRTSCSS
jgi:hypothetical protein